MKRLTIPLACASLLMLSPLAPAPAFAAGNPSPDVGALPFCKTVTAENGDRLGHCVAFQSTNFRDNYNGLVTHLCELYQDQVPDVFASYYDSYSDCVRDGAAALFALG